MFASWAMTFSRTIELTLAASSAWGRDWLITLADSACCNQPLTAGRWSMHVHLATAVIAPQSEWPQITMSVTPSTATAYSTVADTPPGWGL
ncbi:hypothetical protein D9M71_773350 [compost metagenome]